LFFVVDEYITFRLPLDKINEGFQLMHDGKAIRSVVYFGAIPADGK
jgi:S-(hydroxymethyl)glutathione dehydrogenase/alcohol dehydrogenase